ncbi:MAG: undecaprenyl-diphosphate phosphatase [Oscillospiraceae bacterium]|nr:undecaprenyl-diphosphate phosphatase [Oscillospiraceae bacterium]
MKTVVVIIVSAIVQGLTEFFPISSSGHLLLAQHFFGYKRESSLVLNAALHLGTLVAIILGYRKVIWKLILEACGLVSKCVTRKKEVGDEYYKRLLLLLTVSTAPLVLTFFFRGFYERVMGLDNMLLLGIFFMFTALFMEVSGRRTRGFKNAMGMKYSEAFLMGILQALLAPLPGISRSGLTIAVGLFLGLAIKYCVMYAFLLGIPTILGAGVVILCESWGNFAYGEIGLMCAGALLAACIGYACINVLTEIIRRRKFYIFSFYTLGVGIFTVSAWLFEEFF